MRVSSALVFFRVSFSIRRNWGTLILYLVIVGIFSFLERAVWCEGACEFAGAVIRFENSERTGFLEFDSLLISMLIVGWSL